MAKSYKIWIEIEELNEKDEARDGGDIGVLPDSVGYFHGKTAKRDALAHMASIVRVHGIDPENSDAVRLTDRAFAKEAKRNSLSHMDAVAKGQVKLNQMQVDVAKAQANCGGLPKEMLGFCKRCGTLLKKNGKCKDQTCPFNSRLQNETFTEG